MRDLIPDTWLIVRDGLYLAPVGEERLFVDASAIPANEWLARRPFCFGDRADAEAIAHQTGGDVISSAFVAS